MGASNGKPDPSEGGLGPAGVDATPLPAIMVMLGCPPEKSREMAAQLDKRAQQLAAQKNTTYDAALAHLLELMRQGWAAKERGL